MIIIGQDRKVILNYENIEAIGVAKATEDRFKIIAATVTDNEIEIAQYKTEERAKEILEETTFAYANMEMLKFPQINIHQIIPAAEMVRNICYKMPEE